MNDIPFVQFVSHNDHFHMLLTTSVKALFMSPKTLKPLYERQGIIGDELHPVVQVAREDTTCAPFSMTHRNQRAL